MSPSNPQTEAPRPLPAIVRQLGYGGLIPFVALAVGAWGLPEHRVAFQQAQLVYAAVILSFLGAVHWGLALAANRSDPVPYVWGVMPSLLGWLAVLLPSTVGAPLASISLMVCWIVDRQLIKGWPFYKAYGQLRTRLTVIAWLALVLGRVAPQG